VEEAIDDLPPDEVALYDLGRALFIDVGVPGSFGIDDHVGSVAALSETSAKGDLDPTFQGVLHEMVLQRLQGLLGAVLTASGPCADKEMMTVKTHFLPRSNRFFISYPPCQVKVRTVGEKSGVRGR
jgi:hypothetical protein